MKKSNVKIRLKRKRKRMISRGYKFRLYPTEVQETALRQQAGSCRFLWNYFLANNQDIYSLDKKFKFFNQMANELPVLKNMFPFLGETFSQSLQQVLRHLDSAIKSSYKKEKGFPVFKCKSDFSDSFTVPQKFRIMKNHIFIPKIGEVKFKKHRNICGKVKHITVSQDGNRWFVSVCTETNKTVKVKPINKSKIVGIDLGVKTLAVLSDGTEISNPKITKKYSDKLARLQRSLSKKVKGSNNKLKCKIKIQDLHRKIRNIRNDNLHKVTHDMIAKYDGFICEDLNVKGMVKNHKLARSISDCGWGKFTNFLKYKAEWNGKHYSEIGRFEKSSKTCSICGFVNNALTLKDRSWICNSCKTEHDRDGNASVNIREFGLNNLKNDIPMDNRELTLGEMSCLRTVDEPRKSSVFKSVKADLARSHGFAPWYVTKGNGAI